MAANNDPISNALNMKPLEIEVNPLKSIIQAAHNDSAQQDFEKARGNIHDILDNGTDAMVKLAQIADQSQHPRAFEVLATLMKTMLDANKDLLDLQKKIRDIKDSDEPHNDTAGKSITNNLFVGSTSELQKMIENLKK